MRKSEKRRLGAARQAENRAAYEQECADGLNKVKEHRAEQQRLLMAERARKDAGKMMRGMAEGVV